MQKNKTQRDHAKEMLQDRGMMRLTEFIEAGITAATIGRMHEDGEVRKLARGLYQLPDAPLDANHSYAEAAKLVPRGVLCLTSALLYHDLTDQLPRKVYIAIGNNDWHPRISDAPIHFVRFSDAFLTKDVETVLIEGVPVKVFGVAKTIADCFRHSRTVDKIIALEGLQEALSQRKATPCEIVEAAISGKVYSIVRPYLEALTANA